MSTIQQPPIRETTASPAQLNLAKVLRQMLSVSDKVSDLIFSPGRPPQVELLGKLQPVPIAGLEKLTQRDCLQGAGVELTRNFGRDVAGLQPALRVPDADRLRVVLVVRLGHERERPACRESVVLQRVEPVRDTRDLDNAHAWIVRPNDLLRRRVAQPISLSCSLEPEP